METRRMMLALVAGFAVFFAYTVAYNWLFPPALPRPVPARGPEPAGAPAAGPAGPGQVAIGPAPAQTRPATASAPVAPGAGLVLVGGEVSEPVALGSAQHQLELELSPRGAAVSHMWLSERQGARRYRYRAEPDSNEPYELLAPVGQGGRRRLSFETPKLLIKEFADGGWRPDRLVWKLAERDAEHAVFTGTLAQPPGGGALLRLVKTYALEPGAKLLRLSLAVRNLSDRPLHVALVQDGPVGIRKEHMQYDMRSLVWAQRGGEEVKVKAKRRGNLAKRDSPLSLDPTEPGRHLLWTALANKYFGVFTRPLPAGGQVAEYIQHVQALVALPQASGSPGDMLARFTTGYLPVAPGGQQRLAFEIYAGPKNPEVLRRTNPAFADRHRLAYVAAQDVDVRCGCCLIPGLPGFMKWVLSGIHLLVRNYGVAIIILVLIVRAILHPLSVYQQKSMYRVQEAQARLQPKLQALRERYANDKATLNRETMRLMAEEGANPAGMLVGMLPMLLQMPILIALWTAINTDIHLRHAAFDGWWIRDLSAPDALYKFGGAGVTVPILAWLPLIGRMFRNIPALNLLPILMGVSMWLQQKYMPKPAQRARLAAARQAGGQQGPRKGRQGMSPEDQLRQQQMIAYVMSIIFPLMFYYMPSGLNLYWMATNVFGIFESLRIGKQLERDKQRRERAGPGRRPQKPPGLLARLMKRVADQAEQLQRRADQLSTQKKKRR